MKNEISANVGIWETKYSAVFHRNGEITITAPFVKWRDNEGILDFRKIRLSGRESTEARKFFAAGKLSLGSNTAYGMIGLEHILRGELYPGVIAIAE